MKVLSCQELSEMVTRHGSSDPSYLTLHYHRYTETLKRFCSTPDNLKKKRLLDIGAHWLHQSVLFSQAGFKVTALDLPVIFEQHGTQKLAEEQGITLLSNDDLENPAALNQLPEDSFDCVLITEVLEHLAFNPVELWTAVYRVLAPGGTIILTTPNYYALRTGPWRRLRFLAGYGGGISVPLILNVKTHGHHWKEYSLKELKQYFAMLSPDFNVKQARYMTEYRPTLDRWGMLGRAVLMVERCIPFLRPQLYLEIGLPSKQQGITIVPSW